MYDNNYLLRVEVNHEITDCFFVRYFKHNKDWVRTYNNFPLFCKPVYIEKDGDAFVKANGINLKKFFEYMHDYKNLSREKPVRRFKDKELDRMYTCGSRAVVIKTLYGLKAVCVDKSLLIEII